MLNVPLYASLCARLCLALSGGRGRVWNLSSGEFQVGKLLAPLSSGWTLVTSP